jgi:hypothetical protein
LDFVSQMLGWSMEKVSVFILGYFIALGKPSAKFSVDEVNSWLALVNAVHHDYGPYQRAR